MGVLGYDFNMFYDAGKALLSGSSPYIVDGYFSPLVFAYILCIFSFFPYQLAFIFWTFLNLSSVVFLVRRKAVKTFLFLPVLFAIWVGQVDLILLAFAFSKTWYGVALLSLKPQLAIWLFPYFVISWFRNDEKQKIIQMMVAVGVLYLIPTAIDPGWWNDWFAASPSVLTYAEHASSIFGVFALLPEAINSGFVVFVILVLCGGTFYYLQPTSEGQYLSWVAIFNPIANIYSHSLLLKQIDWIAITLSWLMLPLSLRIHSGIPWVIIPIYIILRKRSKLF